MSEPVNPVSDEELADMKRRVASDDNSIFSSFSDEASNSTSKVIGGMLGLNETGNELSILQRTNLQPHEVAVIVDMIRLAKHGIGGEVLDIPIPYILQQAINYCSAKISVTDEKGHGMSRDEVVAILTQMYRNLEARELEEKRRRQGQGAAG